MSEPERFKPKPLDRESLDVPLDPRWKVMGPEEEARLHARAVADHRRFQPLNPRMRRRLIVYVLGTAVGFALLGWLFLSASWRALAIFAGAGAALGAAVAWLRPSRFTTSGLYAVAGLVGSYVLGTHALLALLTGMLCASVGVLMGVLEELKRFDGE